jgi:uncharacterized membrane protein HdeD (DUF308 family)
MKDFEIMNSNSKASVPNKVIGLIKGAMLILFGIWLLISPIDNLKKLSLIFGILILFGGLFEVGLAFNKRKTHKNWEWVLTSGILDVLLGAFLIANPRFILLVVTAFVSIWLFIRGIIALRLSFILKKANNENYIYRLMIGVAFVLLAIIFIWHPEIFGITIAFWTALSFISLGIFRIAMLFYSRN